MGGRKAMAYLQYAQLTLYADKKSVASSAFYQYNKLKEAPSSTKSSRSKTVGDALEAGVELLPSIGARVKTPYVGGGVLGRGLECRQPRPTGPGPGPVQRNLTAVTTSSSSASNRSRVPATRPNPPHPTLVGTAVVFCERSGSCRKR